MPLKKALAVIACYSFTVMAFRKLLKAEHFRLLFAFLTGLMGIFAAGVWAREAEIFSFLYFYPFRVGSLILLLFFSWSLFYFWEWTLRWPNRKMRALSVITAVFLVFGAVYHDMPKKLLKGTGGSIIAWRDYLNNRTDAFSEMAMWARNNTAESDVFIAPPWEYGFWLLAARAEVANYKYVEPQLSSEKWKARLIDLNGGIPFKRSGAGVLEEFKANYPRLKEEQLRNLAAKYNASYYVTVSERPDLPFRLVYSNNSYYLYDLLERDSD